MIIPKRYLNSNVHYKNGTYLLRNDVVHILSCKIDDRYSSGICVTIKVTHSDHKAIIGQVCEIDAALLSKAITRDTY